MTTPKVREAIEVLDAAFKRSARMEGMLATPGVAEALAVVGCDIEARGKGAPDFEDLKPFIVSVAREPQRLSVQLEAGAKALAEEYVAAEQRCCGSQMAFAVVAGDPVVIQISATEDFIDAVEGWMTPN